MDVIEAFVAHGEAAIAVEPRQRALDDPAGAPQAAAVADVAAREQRLNPARLEFGPVPLGVVAAIALDQGGSPRRPSRATADRRHRIDQGQQDVDVRAVRRGQLRDERDAARFREEVVLAARLAAIGWVRSSFFPPRSARTDALSTTARARSTWPRRRSSVSSTACNCCHTPARCHATKRRQHTVPEPQPISRGSRFHGSPLRSTNRIPVRTARSGIGVRPAYRRFRGLRFGNNGSIRFHSSSSTENVAMRDRLRVGHATVPTLGKKYKS